MPAVILENKDKPRSTEQRKSISEQEKIRIVSEWILLSPPGELQEVLKDLQKIFNNDNIWKEISSKAIVQYDRLQLTPTRIQNAEHLVLISEHNHIGGLRYYDPRSKQSFLYDHYSKIVSDYGLWTCEATLENWRASLECELDIYVSRRFKNGTSNVFVRNCTNTLIACVESHDFQPKSYHNGSWRSEWVITKTSSSLEVTGYLQIHAHYCEDGNTRLISSKEVKGYVDFINEYPAKELTKMFEEFETDYQTDLLNYYEDISTKNLKTLRRALPLTRSKIDWNRMLM